MFFQGFKSYRGKAVQAKGNVRTVRFLWSVIGRMSNLTKILLNIWGFSSGNGCVQ